MSIKSFTVDKTSEIEGLFVANCSDHNGKEYSLMALSEAELREKIRKTMQEWLNGDE